MSTTAPCCLRQSHVCARVCVQWVCTHSLSLPPPHPLLPPWPHSAGLGTLGARGSGWDRSPCAAFVFFHPTLPHSHSWMGFSNTPWSPLVPPPSGQCPSHPPTPHTPTHTPSTADPRALPTARQRPPWCNTPPPPAALRGGREPPGKGITPKGCRVWGCRAAACGEREPRARDGGGGCRMGGWDVGEGCGTPGCRRNNGGRGISKDGGCGVTVERRRMRDGMRDEG